MSPGGRGTATRMSERVVRLCDQDAEERPLRVALVEELRRSVGFDWYAWLLTDPETEVGTAPLADVPALPDLPRLIRAKYLTDVNRWTALDAGTVALRAGGPLERSTLWREVLSEYDVVDVASLVFRDPHGCWGWLDLWRVAPAPPFDDVELASLAAVVGPVTTALRRAQGRTFDDAPPQPALAGPAVLC